MSASVAFDMTVDDVRSRVEEVKLVSIMDPDEGQYLLADLQEDILRAIADGTDNPYDLAYTFFEELDKTLAEEEGEITDEED